MSRLSDEQIQQAAYAFQSHPGMDCCLHGNRLLADREAILAENATLKARLHDQSLATMEASSLISAEVNDAIRRSAGFPEDYTPEGHPAAQNVAMVMARLQAENATLREDAERVRKRCDDSRDMIGVWLYNIHAGVASFDKDHVVSALECLSRGLTRDAAIDAARK